MYSEYNILNSFPLEYTHSVEAMSQINHSPLGDQVYAIIWERIMSRQIGPGDKLSDLRLSEDLGVSRTPVREALHRLAQDGIVRSESRRGFFLTSFSSQDVAEVYDIRTALESLSVRLALPHLSAAELDEAQSALVASREEITRGGERAEENWLTIDRAFHRLLAQRAQNRRLESLIAGLQAQIGVFQVYGIHSSPLRLLSIDHHEAILAELKARDGAAAGRAMERHIQEVKEWVLAEFVSRERQPIHPTAPIAARRDLGS
jgi:DNA-binding GntR family transcriptional regulator